MWPLAETAKGFDGASTLADLQALAGATLAFDLDGTLVDSAPDLVGTLNVILEQEGVAPLPFTEARALIGHGARRLMERGFAAQGLSVKPDAMPELFARFIAHYEAHIADESRPFAGVPEALAQMKAAGARLVVCTNKLTGLSRQVLDALDLSRFFDAVVGADSAPAAKPDARHLLAAVAAAGGDPARAVMVGDAATDAGAARAAKVPLILVTFGYTEVPAADLGPDILLDRFEDMPGACARLLTACPPR
jgi:phosphoglycolate phosphatase